MTDVVDAGGGKIHLRADGRGAVHQPADAERAHPRQRGRGAADRAHQRRRRAVRAVAGRQRERGGAAGDDGPRPRAREDRDEHRHQAAARAHGARRAAGGGDQLRDAGGGRGGRRHPGLAAARRGDVHPPQGPRGVLALRGADEAARAAGGHLSRRAGHHHPLGDPARHHRPPRGRQADDHRGRRGAGGGCAGHGQGAVAHRHGERRGP